MTLDSQGDVKMCQIVACQKMAMFVARIDLMPVAHCNKISYCVLQFWTSICKENLLTWNIAFQGKGKLHNKRSITHYHYICIKMWNGCGHGLNQKIFSYFFSIFSPIKSNPYKYAFGNTERNEIMPFISNICKICKI